MWHLLLVKDLLEVQIDSGFQPLMLDWGPFQVVSDMEGECCGLYFCKKEGRWAAFTRSTCLLTLSTVL